MHSPPQSPKTKQQLIEENRQLRIRLAELASVAVEHEAGSEKALGSVMSEAQYPWAPSLDPHHAGRLLRQSERRYRLLFDRNPDGVFGVDKTGRFVLANPACEVISGYTVAELMQKKFTDLCAPDQLAQTVAHFESNFAQRLHLEFETALIRKDRRRVDLWVAGEPIIEDGNLVAVHCTAKDITDRKRAEEALRTSEERLRRVARAGRIGVFEWNADRDRAYWSPEVYELFGAEPDAVPNLKSWTDTIHPDDREAVTRTLEEAIEQARTASERFSGRHEYRVMHRDGTVLWLNVTIVLEREGEDLIMRGAVRDITERKTAERELRDREAALHLAERAARAGTWDWDIAKGKLRWDPEQFVVFGLDPAKEDASFETWRRVVHPDDEPEASARIYSALKEHTALSSEYRVVLPDGTIRWIYAAGEGTYDEKGAPTRMMGICLDVTDRRRAEEALRESEERHRLALDAARLGTWDWHVATGAVIWNDEHYRALGYSPGAIRPTYEAWASRVHPQDLAAVEARMNESMARGGEYRAEYRVLWADKTVHWLETCGSVERDPGGNVIRSYGVLSDITDRKRAELNNEFLNHLQPMLMEVRDPVETVRQTLQLLGEHLGVSLAFGEMTPDGEWVTVQQQYTAGRSSAVGRHRALAFVSDEDRNAVVKGTEMIVTDVATDPRTAEHVESFHRLQVAAFVTLPVMIDGTIRGIMNIGSAQPRAWRPDEVQVLRAVNARLFPAVERARAEAALRESEERLRFALATSHIGAWDLDLTTHAAFRSLDHDRIFGYTEPLPQWTYEQFLEHVLPEDRHAVDAKFRHATSTRSDWGFQCRIRRADGEVRWIWAAGRHRSDPAGGIRRMSGIVQDISAQKTAEQELRSSLERLRLAQQASNSGMWEWDLRTDENFWSDELWRVYGLEPYSCKPSFDSWLGTIHPDDRERAAQAAKQAAANGTEMAAEWRIHDHDGADRWVMSRGKPMRGPDGQTVRYIGIAMDITDRKRAETTQAALMEERSRLLESERFARGELERANRLKDEFLANLSHELRTPLTSILGWAQILRRGHAGPDSIAKGLEVIERNTRVQAQLISDLLDMSRIISGKMRLETKSCDPVEALESAIDSLAPAAEAKEIRIEKRITQSSRPILGDPSRLQQAFWNLLSNAVKFTPSGGRVKVVMRQTESRVEVVVQDTGKGVNPDFLPHIFERFRQADSSASKDHAGLGLGLAIVRHLVELHGGTVKAESPGEGQGATFTITLPIVATRRDEEVASVSSREDLGVLAIPLNGIKVLFVDDEPDTREMVKRLLEAYGVAVATAASAAEGFALLQEFRPDVLVGDIGMPGENGYEMIRKIRELPPEAGGQTPAIALTAYSRMEDRTRAILAGYQYHLAKPVEAAELVTTVGMMTQRLPGTRRHSVARSNDPA